MTNLMTIPASGGRASVSGSPPLHWENQRRLTAAGGRPCVPEQEVAPVCEDCRSSGAFLGADSAGWAVPKRTQTDIGQRRSSEFADGNGLNWKAKEEHGNDRRPL
jgi:hypothetical protein